MENNRNPHQQEHHIVLVTKLVERNVTLVQEHNKGKILKCRGETVLVMM